MAGLFGAGFPSLNCVDMSRWGGELTDEEARCLISKGVRLCIVGTGHPNGAGLWARQQAESWLNAGGEHLQAYVYLYFAGEAYAQVGTGRRVLDGLPVERWWLDAEDVESPGLTTMQRWQFLRECIATLGSLPKGIYSGRWWWRPNMGPTTEFRDLPLWDSNYPPGTSAERAIITPWAGREYGGFAEPEIYQYRGTTELCGQSVDLNWARTLEDDMTPEQVREIVLAELGLGLAVDNQDDVRRPVFERFNAVMVKRGELTALAWQTEPEGVAAMEDVYAYAKAKGYV